MTPFKKATVPMEEILGTVKGWMILWRKGDKNTRAIAGDGTEEEAYQRLLEFTMDSMGDNVYLNDTYQVVKRDLGNGMTHLSIKRIDKSALHDWRDYQKIKNELVGPECEAIELYPAESRLVDNANQYHCWVANDPKVRYNIGFKEVVYASSIQDCVHPDRQVLCGQFGKCKSEMVTPPRDVKTESPPESEVSGSLEQVRAGELPVCSLGGSCTKDRLVLGGTMVPEHVGMSPESDKDCRGCPSKGAKTLTGVPPKDEGVTTPKSTSPEGFGPEQALRGNEGEDASRSHGACPYGRVKGEDGCCRKEEADSLPDSRGNPTGEVKENRSSLDPRTARSTAQESDRSEVVCVAQAEYQRGFDDGFINGLKAAQAMDCFHLWCFNDPTYRVPIGWQTRMVSDNAIGNGQQRPFEGGE